MQIANNVVLNSTVAAQGAWVDMARYTTWSLHITGLEVGGSVELFGSNSVLKPLDNQVDPNSVALGTPITATAGTALVDGKTLPLMHWMQARKTVGTTATATNVNIFAQLG